MELSKTQAFCILILFLVGTSLFMGSAGASQSDNWIAILIGMLMAFPLILLYGRLHRLYSGKDLFDMLFTAFGPIFGRIVALLYAWYAFHLGSLVLRNFGEFSKSVSMPETPMLVPMGMIGLLCIWVIFEGIKVLGRSALIIAFGMAFVYLFVQILGLSRLNLQFLLPVLENGWLPVIKAGFSACSFPFAESVLFLSLFPYLKQGRMSYKVMLGCLIASAVIMVLTSIRNTAVLGAEVVSSMYFPSYVAVSRISVGDFIQRIEGSAAVVFVSALFVKVSICLYAVSLGLSRIFKLSSYRVVLVPIGLLMIYQSSFIYDSMMEMTDWAYEYYQYYAFPFQCFLPVLFWLIGEVKNRRGQALKSASSGV
ncbi:GerAB/ArcD/ProY family transporter [Gorillibacterium sp. sgz500922]|uniref:GerAB/ArcD/ProY family transporter n=1 Tax=Gorillibacterium sp. sgz500922 TaxID=3446694 RepID=UPI003F669F2C